MVSQFKLMFAIALMAAIIFIQTDAQDTPETTTLHPPTPSGPTHKTTPKRHPTPPRHHKKNGADPATFVSVYSAVGTIAGLAAMMVLRR